MTQFQTKVNHTYYFKSEEDLQKFVKESVKGDIWADHKRVIKGPTRVTNKAGRVVYPEQFYWELNETYTWGKTQAEAYNFDETTPTIVPQNKVAVTSGYASNGAHTHSIASAGSIAYVDANGYMQWR